MAGIVSLTPGTYLCNTGLTGAANVNLIGAGFKATTIKAGAAMDTLLTLPTAVGQGGRVDGIYLNGNGFAEKCLYLVTCVGWTFFDIRAMNALDAAFVLNNTQNCVFIGCDLQVNGDATATNGGHVRFNHSASGNVFLRCEFNKSRQHGIVFVDCDGSIDPTVAGADGSPQNNTFIGCIIERLQAAGTSQIYMTSGRWNSFMACSMSMQPSNDADNPGPATGTMIKLDGSGDPFCVYQNIFDRCEFTTTISGGDVRNFLDTIAGYRTTLRSCNIGACTTILTTDDTADSIWWDPFNVVSTGTFYSGTGSQDSVVNGGNYKVGTTFTRQIIGSAGEYLVGLLDINHTQMRLRSTNTPASAGAAGDAGTICWDANYIYVCVSNGNWKRAAIATW